MKKNKICQICFEDIAMDNSNICCACNQMDENERNMVDTTNISDLLKGMV